MKFSVACGDPSSAPTPTVSPEPDFAKLTAARTFARYVALGTSTAWVFSRPASLPPDRRRHGPRSSQIARALSSHYR